MSWIRSSRSFRSRGCPFMCVLGSVTPPLRCIQPASFCAESQIPVITDVGVHRTQRPCPGADTNGGRNCRTVRQENRNRLLLAQQARKGFPIDAQRLRGTGLVAAGFAQDALSVAAAE